MHDADTTPVLIFDLDETVLGVNSFPLWALYLIAGSIPGLGWRRRVALSLHAQSLLLLRKLRQLDHDALLAGLQQAWRRATDRPGEHGKRFQAGLLRHVRPSMQPILALLPEGRIDAVLATAAATDYASGVARALGFRHVLASETDGGGRNSGTRKRDRVLAWLRTQGWQSRPRILLTDHRDDLPLIRECAVVCWFGAAEKLADIADDAGQARCIYCRDLSGDELLANLRSLAVPHQAGTRSAITVS